MRQFDGCFFTAVGVRHAPNISHELLDAVITTPEALSKTDAICAKGSRNLVKLTPVARAEKARPRSGNQSPVDPLVEN
jgi:hypothetical protein